MTAGTADPIHPWLGYVMCGEVRSSIQLPAILAEVLSNLPWKFRGIQIYPDDYRQLQCWSLHFKSRSICTFAGFEYAGARVTGCMLGSAASDNGG